MSRKRLTYKTIAPELRDTSHWPKVDTSAMSAVDVERIERLMPAVVSYLQNGRLRAAADGAAVSCDALLDQVNRCLLPLADGGVLGWAGLIRGLRVKAYHRVSALPEGEHASRQGAGGAFQAFLQAHDDIKAKLDDVIRKGVGTGCARAASTPAKSIWKVFKALVEARVPDPNQYPRNSSNCARRSVERYVKFMIDNDAKARRTAVGEAARAAGQIGIGSWSFSLTDAPLDLIGIDAHHVDCIGTIEIEGPAGPQHVPVERLWIYAVACAESRAVHGYALSIRTEPVAEQIELALEMATKPWKPRELRMPGVVYKPGAGFPMGCVEGFEVFAPAALRMDSAMQSFATRVVQRVRRRFGCAMSWSGIGAWYHNDTIERFFGTLERCGGHQLPTSVGTGPADPKKTDGAAEAIRLNVTMEELIDLLDVAIANYNATAQPGLGHRSPLEVLRAWHDPERQRFIPRALMPPTLFTPELGVAVETRFVRGSRSAGKLVRPHIQLDKATYTSRELATRFDLIGLPLVVHVPEGDLRTLHAYLENGTYVGELKVREKGWRRTKHSRDVRKTINRLRDARELADASDDYVVDYLRHLATKALADARKRPNNISAAATQLAEAVRSTGAAVPSIGARRPAAMDMLARPVPVLLHLPKPSWDRGGR